MAIRGWRSALVAIVLAVTSLGALSACGSTPYPPDGAYLHEVIKPASERVHMKYAIFLCTASDVSDIPLPISYYRKLFLKDGQGTGNIYDYFLNMSYGSIDLDGSVVVGPYAMATPKSVLDIRYNKTRQQTVNDCINAAKQHLWTDDMLKQYVGKVALINIRTDSGYTGTDVVFDPYSFPNFVEHEMGHALGLAHSMTMQVDAGAVHTWSPGGDTEYGDCWDIMSAMGCTFRFLNSNWGATGPELEGAYREKIGWMPQDRVYTYSGKASQTVLLRAVSEPRDSGYLLAKVPLGSGNYYAIEFRRPTGWDQALPHSAVLIHEMRLSTRANELTSFRSFLVSRQNFSSWMPGQVFQDTANKVRIRINSFAGNAASVTISTDVSTDPGPNTGGGNNCDTLIRYTPGPAIWRTPQEQLAGVPVISGCEPQVAITAPAAAARYDGSATTFSAKVTSPLGDTIPEKDIVWQEVATGSTVELGRGHTITATLPRGVHHITVTATDDIIAAATTIKQDYTLCDEALCAPRVAISSPADGTHVGMGQSLFVYASVTDPGLEGAPLTSVSWSLNNSPLASAKPGNIVYGLTLGTPGTYTLALTATSPLLHYTSSAQITVIVDPPSAPPTVAILTPMDGAWYYEVVPPGQSLQIAASGSVNVVSYDWTDTYDLAIHPLASGPTANVTLPITNTANCAVTSHVLKVTGTTADGQTVSAIVTVYLRATCIK